MARIAFKRRGSRTCLDELYQQGCSKVRFPRQENGLPAEAVLINTAGGMTDGDSLHTSVAWRAGAAATVTSQAAERIYRSRGTPAHVRSDLLLEDRADAVWLPQETIVFDGGRLDRRTTVAMKSTASLFAVESMVFGRAAMGEVVRAGSVEDRWRIEVDGKLTFIDSYRIEASESLSLESMLARSSVAHGGSASATVIAIKRDCDEVVDQIRAVFGECDAVCGASSVSGVAIARVLAASGAAMRKTLRTIFAAVQQTGMPRVWNC